MSYQYRHVEVLKVIDGPDGGELLVNKIMVVEGYAVEYDGGAR